MNSELFVYFGTILSSRAFPSSLIPGYVSSTTSSTESVPVLFPGVDMFNHEYGRKVTWSSAGSVISSEDGAAETISQEVEGLTIQINSPAEAGVYFLFSFVVQYNSMFTSKQGQKYSTTTEPNQMKSCCLDMDSFSPRTIRTPSF